MEVKMNTDEIMAAVNTIFISVLDNKNIVLKNETVAKDVPEWDSLSHIQLIVATEKHFNIRFTTREIMSFKDVGDFCQKIQKKLCGT
jgi:acyl carrier protein